MPVDHRSHLHQLESESIFVLREVAAQCERPVLLFSGGKDSILMVHLAAKVRAGAQRLPLAAHASGRGRGLRVVVIRSHLSPEPEAFIRERTAEAGGVELVSLGSSCGCCAPARDRLRAPAAHRLMVERAVRQAEG